MSLVVQDLGGLINIYSLCLLPNECLISAYVVSGCFAYLGDMEEAGQLHLQPHSGMGLMMIMMVMILQLKFFLKVFIIEQIIFFALFFNGHA